jgi:hypothetical protein
VDGVLTDDERRVVGAAHQLGFILSSHWPDVAAHLLAQGAQGDAVASLLVCPARRRRGSWTNWCRT